MVVRELFAKLGFRLDESQIRRFDGFMGRAKQRLNRFTATFRSAFSRVAAALSVGALGLVTRQLITTGDLLGKQAKQLGLTATQLRAWQHAAQISGVTLERFNASLNTFFSQIRGAARGSMEAEFAFKRLGASLKDIEKRDVNDLLLEIADGFTKLDSATEKAAFATQLFGESGRAMIPFLSEGRKGIEKLRGEVFAITGKDGLDKFAAGAEDAADAMTRWKLTTSILVQDMAARFLPMITNAVQWMTRWVSQNSDLIKSLFNVRAILVSLGIVMTAMFAPQVVAMGALGAALLFVYAVIDDIVRFIEGRPSLLGDFFDVSEAKETWRLLKEQIEGAVDAIKELPKAWEDAPDWLKNAIKYGSNPMGLMTAPFAAAGDAAVDAVKTIVQNNTINANGADAHQLFDMLEKMRSEDAQQIGDTFAPALTPDAERRGFGFGVLQRSGQ